MVGVVSSRYNSSGQQIRTPYTADDVDAIAAYCEALDECYLVPIDLVEGTSQIQLRVSPPKNGQRAALNWAAEHRLDGAVAQLGERRLGMAEATGSSPVSSIPARDRCQVVGAHQFRNLFGWYAERAAAGEEFLITRRGKAHVRLSPARERLPLETTARLSAPSDASDL